MSYRFMRIIVLFDLPVGTSTQVRSYTKFRKYLIKNGFMMLQESVYCKLAINQTASQNVIEQVKRNKPEEGLVQVLAITEKQYARMECIVGDANSSILNSDERLIVL